MVKGKSKRRYTTPPFSFDPNSLNAQLATILSEIKSSRENTTARLTAQDVTLGEIKTQAIKTNGRVGALETWRETSKAKLAGISLTVGVVGGLLFKLAEVVIR